MIQVRKAVKEYQGEKTPIRALRGLSMEVGPGEFLSVAGPSGSGKTTLLNVVGCIDSLSSGEIFIAGRNVTELSPQELSALRREKIGFVFQSFNLIPVLTAFENVSFSLDLLGVKGEDSRQKVLAMLAEVGLEGLENRRPGELSGGQQQRVAIARALVKKPAIVLADEPTANLDSDTSREVLELMRDLNQRHGTIFLFSTHDQLVMDYARRLIRLRDGEIVSDEKRIP